MRKILLITLLLPLCGMAQIGVKAGLNFITVNDNAGISANSRSGYMIGAFFGPRPKKLIGYRTEFMLSRQGYDYKSASNTGHVNLDYLLVPQLISFNFGKRIELHTGFQLGFLLNASADNDEALAREEALAHVAVQGLWRRSSRRPARSHGSSAGT